MISLFGDLRRVLFFESTDVMTALKTFPCNMWQKALLNYIVLDWAYFCTPLHTFSGCKLFLSSQMQRNRCKVTVIRFCVESLTNMFLLKKNTWNDPIWNFQLPHLTTGTSFICIGQCKTLNRLNQLKAYFPQPASSDLNTVPDIWYVIRGLQPFPLSEQ